MNHLRAASRPGLGFNVVFAFQRKREIESHSRDKQAPTLEVNPGDLVSQYK